ncbi:H-NS family nucleoid-associated regulatory protein [Paucibacter sp. R3-3]|uniref:H-NS family nucleoid-associated regulatory protein n=1 Tax=Roseateles agri TaxID=3098619 RepID=A0ABU5DR12_9BURK|nr:H-NS family nucleoid-associated regulatory protein [Paucibacter sp. R3-3]MDY0748753.1 H-NS family nucleoid-associated regulatory protein [Paucibacter sp. R3-3]
MAKSLSAIKSQIEKLQQQADAMRSTVIARIQRDMAQHGLTIEDLAIKSGGFVVGNGTPAKARKTVKAKAGAAKPAKFADDKGNTWHGIGKRPTWIHEVLAAGRKLEEFLVGKKAKPATDATPKTSVKAAPNKRATGKKAVAATQKAPAKKAVAVKGAARTSAAQPLARKAGKASKSAETMGTAKAASKVPSKRAMAKRPSKLVAGETATSADKPTDSQV